MTPFGIFFGSVMLLATGLGMVGGIFAGLYGHAPEAFFCGCLFATPWAFIIGGVNAKEIANRATTRS